MTPDERKAAVNAALRWSSSLYRYDSNEREAAAHILALDAALTRAEDVVEAAESTARQYVRSGRTRDSAAVMDPAIDALISALDVARPGWSSLAAHDAAGEGPTPNYACSCSTGRGCTLHAGTTLPAGYGGAGEGERT